MSVVTTTSIPQYNPELASIQAVMLFSEYMHDVRISALSVEHVFPVTMLAKSLRQKMIVQDCSDGQAFAHNDEVKIIVSIMSK